MKILDAELIAFDVDGTLGTCDEWRAKVWRSTLTDRGIPHANYATQIRPNVGMPMPELVRRVTGLRGKEVDAFISDFERRFRGPGSEKAFKPYLGVPEALSKLCNSDFKLAIVAQKPVDITRDQLKRANGSNLFDHLYWDGEAPPIWGSDSGCRPKPAPDMFREAMKYWRVEPQYTVVVGDKGAYDIRGGKAAGAKTVGVLTGADSRRVLQHYHPDLILKSVADLPAYLRRAY